VDVSGLRVLTCPPDDADGYFIPYVLVMMALIFLLLLMFKRGPEKRSARNATV
jgi:hypothetical protein